MAPQASFMILATIDPQREVQLRQLLASMNHAPGRVDSNNTLIPFEQFDTLHFARLLIVDDKTIDDIRVYGLTPAFIGFISHFSAILMEKEMRFLKSWRSSRQPDCALFFCVANDSRPGPICSRG